MHAVLLLHYIFTLNAFPFFFSKYLPGQKMLAKKSNVWKNNSNLDYFIISSNVRKDYDNDKGRKEVALLFHMQLSQTVILQDFKAACH